MRPSPMTKTPPRAEMKTLGPQLPLALRAPPDQRFDRFVQAVDGLLEHLRALAHGKGQDGVYLQGSHASGKTHLLLASCAEADAAGQVAAYIPLRSLRGCVREALAGLGDADLLALDDVEAIAGSHEDELALFDLHNNMLDAGRSLLYAAADTPDALGLVLPDLRSRLAHCTRWSLPLLDDAGRAELLRRRASARGLDFDDAALEWLLRRASRDLGSLTSIFEQLDHASLAAQRRLTVPFLRQVLG